MSAPQSTASDSGPLPATKRAAPAATCPIADEVCALLDEHGVPCAKVNSIQQLTEDPQVRHNGSIEVVDHPVGGSLYQPAPAARFEKTPASVRRLAPGHGEHTEEVLLEIGVPQDRIVSLRNEGVLGP